MDIFLGTSKLTSILFIVVGLLLIIMLLFYIHKLEAEGESALIVTKEVISIFFATVCIWFILNNSFNLTEMQDYKSFEQKKKICFESLECSRYLKNALEDSKIYLYESQAIISIINKEKILKDNIKTDTEYSRLLNERNSYIEDTKKELKNKQYNNNEDSEK